jgi:hypothetical protein
MNCWWQVARHQLLLLPLDLLSIFVGFGTALTALLAANVGPELGRRLFGTLLKRAGSLLAKLEREVRGMV